MCVCVCVFVCVCYAGVYVGNIKWNWGAYTNCICAIGTWTHKYAVYIRLCVNVCVCVLVCVHMYTCVRPNVCLYVCVWVCVLVSVYVCVLAWYRVSGISMECEAHFSVSVTSTLDFSSSCCPVAKVTSSTFSCHRLSGSDTSSLLVLAGSQYPTLPSQTRWPAPQIDIFRVELFPLACQETATL